MIAYPDCVACGGTGTSSRGHQCTPCWNRRNNGEGVSRRSIRRDDSSRRIDELKGLIRQATALNKVEETKEQRVERMKQEFMSLLRAMQ